jgi:protein-S-isoprenylcysteine O-methyltransferase Ste14
MILPFTVVRFCWAALGLYWIVSALGTKKTAVNEDSAIRVTRLSILGLTLLLLLTHKLSIGPLAHRFIPLSPKITWFGVGLTALGVALAIWARAILGRNWSDKVVLKVDHELIRRGPYRYLRHPIYTGVLLAVAGTALAVGKWSGIIALLLLGTTYSLKAMREEELLATNFGEAFADYKKQTGFFLPRL